MFVLWRWPGWVGQEKRRTSPGPSSSPLSRLRGDSCCRHVFTLTRQIKLRRLIIGCIFTLRRREGCAWSRAPDLLISTSVSKSDPIVVALIPTLLFTVSGSCWGMCPWFGIYRSRLCDQKQDYGAAPSAQEAEVGGGRAGGRVCWWCLPFSGETPPQVILSGSTPEASG